ncbi:cell division protein [Candidatus Photodesmus blepharus]|uniref:Cell division protein FtsL n=1 Tax=Candidatus Photodesmus blepharonis TaxID=1179155 RepID=A0A084CMU1_9GAMM|nr:cell division protein FtsL [Candidatus Photodesmus blepharus]KEY91120.1 cell division protein [Candidatus Photodesmus blepharus]
MHNVHSNLAKIIAKDLFTVGRFPLILLLLIFISAVAIVFITHHSRQAIFEKNQMLLEHDRLSDEWYNLILEETALSDHSRVQEIAKGELNMQRPDSDKEIIISP